MKNKSKLLKSVHKNLVKFLKPIIPCIRLEVIFFFSKKKDVLNSPQSLSSPDSLCAIDKQAILSTNILFEFCLILFAPFTKCIKI